MLLTAFSRHSCRRVYVALSHWYYVVVSAMAMKAADKDVVKVYLFRNGNGSKLGCSRNVPLRLHQTNDPLLVGTPLGMPLAEAATVGSWTLAMAIAVPPHLSSRRLLRRWRQWIRNAGAAAAAAGSNPDDDVSQDVGVALARHYGLAMYVGNTYVPASAVPPPTQAELAHATASHQDAALIAQLTTRMLAEAFTVPVRAPPPPDAPPTRRIPATDHAVIVG